jgi:hypothetical protein
MLYSEIIAVCSQIHTKHINTLCGQNVELLNVKLNPVVLQWLLGYEVLIFMAVRNRNGSPLAQEDSRWPISAEAQARTHSSTRGIYGRQNRIRTGFPSSILVFPVSTISPVLYNSVFN